MKTAVRYGLENLKTVHDAFSVGFSNNHKERPIIIAPNRLAVIKYICPNWLKKKGSILNKTIIKVVTAITLTALFSSQTTGNIGILAF